MDPFNGVPILHLPIHSAGTSKVLADAAVAHGYDTLKAILAIPLNDLIKMEWITQDMWTELQGIIEQLPPDKGISM